MLPLWPHTLVGICYSWFYHTWLITYLWPSLSLCKLFRPHGLILYFDVPSSSIKNTCLLLYMTFKPILACTHEFWPQTHIHQDVCINPDIFGVFLIWVQRSSLLAFHIPWDHSDLTLHYPFGVLYKEPLGYIEEKELKRKETIVHCCLSLLILGSASLCPFGALCVLPKLAFSCELAIKRWRIEVVETPFIWFVDMPIEVVTLIRSDFINRNIFSCPINVQLNE